MNKRCVWVLALISMVLSAPGVSAADSFSAGFATTGITPPAGWRRAGNYTEFISAGVHDPLFGPRASAGGERRQGSTRTVWNVVRSVPEAGVNQAKQ